MIKFNRLMRQTLSSPIAERIKIPEIIQRQIDQDFEVLSDAYTFRFLRKNALIAPRSRFPDLTGVECYANEMSVDREDHSHHCFLGLNISIAVLSAWAKQDKGLVLRSIVSESTEMTHLTFHVVRADEFYLADDLDSYPQPILVCDSDASISCIEDLQILALKCR